MLVQATKEVISSCFKQVFICLSRIKHACVIHGVLFYVKSNIVGKILVSRNRINAERGRIG